MSHESINNSRVLKGITYIATCEYILYLLTVMSRIEFNIELDFLTKDPSSEIFHSNDIANKIICLNSKKPAGPKKETVWWQRVHDRFLLNSYQRNTRNLLSLQW